jgi:serine/threonine-protein kinase
MTAPLDPLSRLRAALVGQYDIDRVLGQGAMGTVFLGKDRALDREVAIKVVAVEVASSPVLRERFLQEARVVARLRHPNIVAVYAAGEADGQLYFAMELVRGESLRELLQREGRIPADRARSILHDLALALDYAHSQGVVHRDVKPENILLDAETGRAMLTDFGVARALERDGSLTGTGVVLGSPRYMSPEQATGERTLDGRSDLYSLGLVGYEMLLGKPVVEGTTAASILVKHLTETAAPLARAVPGAPREVADTVDRALAKAPEQRWSTGREMADALGGLTTTGSGATTGAWRPKRTTRVGVIAAAATVLAIAVAAGVFLRGGSAGSRQAFVVVPFEVQSGNQEVQWLREGAVNMLTLSLSQWTDLAVTDYERTLDFVRAEGVDEHARVSLEAARRVARRANAGSLVMGQVSTTRDSLVVVARLYDASNGRLLNTETRASAIDADPRPTFDALARYLLDVSGGAAATTVDLARATTSSLQAYRDYIEGLRALNRWDLDRADSLLASAIERDSTFALAYHKRSLVYGWRDANNVAGVQHAERAQALSSRLPPRERNLVLAQVHLSRGLQRLNQGDTTGRGELREAVRLYETMTATDSLSAEGWYGLGDSRHHLGSQLPFAEGRDVINGSVAAFRKTLAIDPDFHLAYSHLIDNYVNWSVNGNGIALLGDSVVEARALPEDRRNAARDSARSRAISTAKAWLAADPDVSRPYNGLARALRVAGRADSAAAVARAGAMRLGDAGGSLWFEAALYDFLSGTSTGGAAVDTALSKVPPVEITRRPRGERTQLLGGALSLAAASGDTRLLARAADYFLRADSTYAFTGRSPAEHLPWVVCVLRVAMGEEVTPAIRSTLLEGTRAIDRATGAQANNLRFASQPLAYLVFLATRDSAAGAMAARWSGSQRMIELDAARSLAAGDSAKARDIAREFPSPDSLRNSNFGLAGLRTIARAEVLAQLGDLRNAIGNYEALDPLRFNFSTVNEPGFAVYVRSFAARGRLYEQLGNPAKAKAAYQRFLAYWTIDDPVTARERAEVRAALARLADSPR